MFAVIADCDYFVNDKVSKLIYPKENKYSDICLQMAEAKKCIAELDVDQDGQVSYPEFMLVWKYKK